MSARKADIKVILIDLINNLLRGREKREKVLAKVATNDVDMMLISGQVTDCQ
jgi:hypothetical protein